MTPLRHPRDAHTRLVAAARYKAVCRTATIENRGRRNMIRIKVAGNQNMIWMPYLMAIQIYNMAKGHCEPELDLNQDMTMDHARKICKWMQRKEIWIRVQQLRMDEGTRNSRDMWNHEMIGLA